MADIVTLPPIVRKTGTKLSQVHLLLMSDLHLEAADTDRALIKEELDWAKENDARILIAGDVLNLLLPKDYKRFHPNVLPDGASGINALLNWTIDEAMKVLGPYADYIYMIGMGNHETAVVKYHSVDIIALLLERLQGVVKRKGHVIAHGGYTGGVRQRFSTRASSGERGCCCAFNIFYHHGMGGGSPVTKGTIDFNRFATYIGGEHALWFGHKHNRMAVSVMRQVFPTTADDFRFEPVWHLQTGSYAKYDLGKQFNETDGRKTYGGHFAIERGIAPQGRGGLKLLLRVAKGPNGTRVVKSTVLADSN